MATGGLLSIRLGQIRRRLRLGAALEGAVLGGAIAAATLAAGVAICRARGGAPPAGAVAALLFMGLGVGATARALRAIPLARCARLADAALDGQDRLLSALDLASAPSTPFSRALIADAVRRAELLVPSAAVPARRPRGLTALGLTALTLAAATFVPASSRAARVGAPAHAVARRPPLPGGALDAEQEADRAALAEAARLGDERLAKLAADMEGTLRRLADGTLGDGAALEELRALEARAAEAAQAAKQDGQAAQAAARALAETAETRPAAKAVTEASTGAGDDDRARDALAASASSHPAETARALSAAAQNVAAATADTGEGAGTDEKQGPRRLARNEENAAPASKEGPGGEEPEQRRLERLRRDLDDTASRCQSGDPSCRSGAGQRGSDLERLERRGASRDGLEQLERTAQQLRGRISRGELADGDAHAMRSFARAARGDDAPSDDRQQGAGGTHDGASTTRTAAGDGAEPGPSGEGASARAQQGAGTGAASAALGVEADAPGEATAGTGSGIGHQPGGPPLGAHSTQTTPARGSEVEASVADGAGPSRAEVIGTAAGHGFASRTYARAYVDYRAAVEDALAATAVPEGKRYLVRRYFDLIRPRAPAPRSAR